MGALSDPVWNDAERIKASRVWSFGATRTISAAQVVDVRVRQEQRRATGDPVRTAPDVEGHAQVRQVDAGLEAADRERADVVPGEVQRLRRRRADVHRRRSGSAALSPVASAGSASGPSP